MKLPSYMLTCYFCMQKFDDADRLNMHLESCVYQDATTYHDGDGLKFLPFRKIRNLVGEVVFATEWKRLMDTPLEYCDWDDCTRFGGIVGSIREPVTQHHASLASSFILWLGTNCGRSYLIEAARLAKADTLLTRPSCYLAQWAAENRRRNYVNGGVRMVEHFLSTQFDKSPVPVGTVHDYETIDAVAYWLGTDAGQDFLERCEKLITIRKRGLSDRDLVEMSLTIT